MTLEMEGGGRLRLWEEGGRVFFRCERPLSREGLYKVWIRGDSGEMLLGTLVPEGGQLMLCRTLWGAEVRRCGCWPVRSARCEMAFPFQQRRQNGWYWEERPQTLVDAETARLGEWRGMFCYKGEGELFLASPLRRESPVPLSHLFCLAVPGTVWGERCLIWRFDGEGKPVFPNRLGAGEESKSR